MRSFKTFLAVMVFALGTAAWGDYKIKEADSLNIHYILGAEAVGEFGPKQMTLEVPPGGLLSLPYVGEVQASGKTVAELQAEITNRLKKRFPLSECFVLLTGIRQTFFSVIGEVKNGGQYLLSPGLTLREALAKAGSPLRRPELLQAFIFRDGKLYKNFDLYKAMSLDDISGAETLQSGDVISIQTKRQLRIWAAGMTREAGEVTIEEGQGLRELVARLASIPLGEKSAEKREQVFVTVMRGGRKIAQASVFDFDNGNAPASKLEDGDFVTIAPRETVRVWVFGSVGAPGQYDVPLGATILQALSAAGGPKGDATLRDVELMRGDKNVRLDVSKSSSASDKLKEVAAGDILYVGANTRRIAVLGQVNVPGLHYLNDDIVPRVSDAISMAGGLTRRGPANRIWILRTGPGGAVTKLPVDFSKFLNNGDTNSNPQLFAGDVVMVGETPRIDMGEAVGLALGVLGLRNIFK